ncbi:MAG: hypothetical protein GWP08_10545 [Nitrospiraceae bacterium]|nr:hypothetical protein [Nitrospiraceae bacterium]
MVSAHTSFLMFLWGGVAWAGYGTVAADESPEGQSMNRVGWLSLLTVAFVAAFAAQGEDGGIDLRGWEDRFAFQYDYVLAETAGLERTYEPVEVTLTMPGDPAQEWRNHIRVVRLLEEELGELTPHQALGTVSTVAQPNPGTQVSQPAASVNVVFLAQCPAQDEVTYRLYWGLPGEGDRGSGALATAGMENGLEIAGEAPGLTVGNEHYTIELDSKSGAFKSVRRAGHGDDRRMFYKTIPCHFGTDIWSPPQAWDHDYDWAVPPNQRLEGGETALRYHRWGPLRTYRDVVVSITYTFYAHVPYVHVSSTMVFTENRSARAVRMGEIVVSHSRAPGPNEKDADGKSPEVFTHYAWPDDKQRVVTREINAHRDAEGRANIEGVAPGALAILDRDVPWVAGYHLDKGYGMASLRRSQFTGNQLGGPIPQSAACTYVANYGWGFTYWSRPMAYPLGAKETPLDRNTVIAAGTLFATEEALLVFEPDAELREVRDAHRRFTEPLRFQFKGTGPW